ncbi:TetR/AcrR family transcriptional regulator [Pseudomonas sp. PCH199]|uniref:TetR/AcrR family transcriptional regulator n=1 Tax=unclassified Pseudomonas TaxID=196821 RepID=UPI000BDB0C99|nr:MULTISPECIES: TetR/AcrR family transcriptional regulator [unclassified Pseudomonas]MCW8277780.1 TetR/AcrR family transcriptional regulator [Pseudomonas sp. PCH199]PAM81941.1 TetR family transcriptional regulator [Pseudomonas sp. ERMR1:02]
MSTRTSLTREDWIHAAQHVLVTSGVDAVRVDTLAKELKITRGSFYYHFKSRGELLEGILGNWRSRATEDVILQLRTAHTSPLQQLQRLLELPSHGQTARDAAAIELGIRAWARRDDKARQAIDEVDRYRLNYIEGLLIQADVTQSEASDRAYLIYAYQISLSLLHSEDTAQDRKDRSARMAHILIPEALPA